MNGYYYLFNAGYGIDNNGMITTISARNMRLSETENYIRIIQIILGVME